MVFALNTSEGRRPSASCKNARSADEQLVIIIYQSIEIRTWPLYNSIVGTVIITNQGSEIRSGPLNSSRHIKI